ncbi:tyrosine-type recombinase/integrase [Nocardia sp. NPDC050412]|uniref:tyrosine-type recombinase/integrase n=1 Tax=Nocardia sp. NPDC050412 TaxID=3364320 RepID=UPI0037B5E9B9
MATIESYELTPKRNKDGKLRKPETRYMVRFRTPSGAQTKKRGFRRKTDAEAFANRVEVRKQDGDYVAPSLGRVTIGELAPDWLKMKKASVAPSNYRTLDTAWRVHVQPRWGHIRIGDVTAESVQGWIVDMRLAAQERAQEKGKPDLNAGATTIIRAYGVLASILDMAVEPRKLIPKNLARGKLISEMLPRKTKKRHVYLTADDVARLAKEAGRHELLVTCLAYCGPRWGEMIALRVRDIDFTRRRITVADNAVQLGVDHAEGPTKGKESRSVPVPRFILSQLAAHTKGRDPDALVFPHPDDATKYLPRPKTVDGWFTGAVKRAKVQPITPHDLRHTCASLSVSAGANVLALARLLGHRDAKETLNTYSDLFDDDLDRLADAMEKAYGSGRAQNVPKPADEDAEAA